MKMFIVPLIVVVVVSIIIGGAFYLEHRQIAGFAEEGRYDVNDVSVYLRANNLSVGDLKSSPRMMANFKHFMGE